MNPNTKAARVAQGWECPKCGEMVPSLVIVEDVVTKDIPGWNCPIMCRPCAVKLAYVLSPRRIAVQHEETDPFIDSLPL